MDKLWQIYTKGQQSKLKRKVKRRETFGKNKSKEIKEIFKEGAKSFFLYRSRVSSSYPDSGGKGKAGRDTGIGDNVWSYAGCGLDLFFVEINEGRR